MRISYKNVITDSVRIENNSTKQLNYSHGEFLNYCGEVVLSVLEYSMSTGRGNCFVMEDAGKRNKE